MAIQPSQISIHQVPVRDQEQGGWAREMARELRAHTVLTEDLSLALTLVV